MRTEWHLLEHARMHIHDQLPKGTYTAKNGAEGIPEYCRANYSYLFDAMKILRNAACEILRS